VSKRLRSSGVRRRAVAPVYTVTVALAVILTAGLTVLLVWRLGLSAVVACLLAVNTTTLLAYAYDKGIAGGGRQRVPERVFHGLALFGGTPAAFVAQAVLRHKTRKASFRTGFWVIAALQVAAVAAWFWLHAR
jgi:uncharacterized membrane protein YsdA (DUF1294 family)